MTVACGTAVQSVVFSCTRCVSEIPTHGWPSMGCLLGVVRDELLEVRCAPCTRGVVCIVHTRVRCMLVSTSRLQTESFRQDSQTWQQTQQLAHRVRPDHSTCVVSEKSGARDFALLLLSSLWVCVCVLCRAAVTKTVRPLPTACRILLGRLGAVGVTVPTNLPEAPESLHPCCRHPHLALEQSSTSRQLEPTWLRMWWWIGRLASMTSVSRCSLSPHSGCSGAPVSDTGCPLNNS